MSDPRTQIDREAEEGSEEAMSDEQNPLVMVQQMIDTVCEGRREVPVEELNSSNSSNSSDEELEAK